MLLLIVSFATGFYLCFCTVPIYDRDMETAVIDDDGVIESIDLVRDQFGDMGKAFITTYLILLGDWDPELMWSSQDGSVPGMPYSVRFVERIMFLCFTFIGLVVMLNVIIALLSDSFAKTQAKSAAFGMIECLCIVLLLSFLFAFKK